jgi:hypothetical protein
MTSTEYPKSSLTHTCIFDIPTEPLDLNSSYASRLGEPYDRGGVSVYCTFKTPPPWPAVEIQTQKL